MLLGLMECAVKFDTVKLGKSIYIEGSHNILSKDINFAFILLQIDFVMANSADPDEIPLFVGDLCWSLFCYP